MNDTSKLPKNPTRDKLFKHPIEIQNEFSHLSNREFLEKLLDSLLFDFTCDDLKKEFEKCYGESSSLDSYTKEFYIAQSDVYSDLIKRTQDQLQFEILIKLDDFLTEQSKLT